MSALTFRQLEIFFFITDHLQNEGYPPTIREIGQAFAIKSPNGVACHLKALRKKGLIAIERRPRGIRLTQYRVRLEPI